MLGKFKVQKDYWCKHLGNICKKSSSDGSYVVSSCALQELLFMGTGAVLFIAVGALAIQ